jgi:hypothetical protein
MYYLKGSSRVDGQRGHAKLEQLAMEKHSGLLRKSIIAAVEGFIRLAPVSFYFYRKYYTYL